MEEYSYLQMILVIIGGSAVGWLLKKIGLEKIGNWFINLSILAGILGMIMKCSSS